MSLTKNAWTLSLQPHAWTCETDEQTSLLEAALAVGVRLPNSCRNGTCRTCLCKMLSGQIAYRVEWPGLSLEEKQEGWILPCVAQARSDVSLDVPAAVNMFD
ncbi:2Fe-2S iron-sulfur cluster-binding protein [Undibacterium sp. Di26W]|uniref:2Fe-2S iron-sulfur cluster-binding protein n=1 Tax=Undibacterium sp. Di26W TaxID=3413035 RepID=UPI003BF1A1FB